MNINNSIVVRLKTQHEAIEPIISVVDKEGLYIRPEPGKWNIHDNIAHLARYQLIYIERVNTILSRHTPFFDRYRAEDDLEFETWRAWETEELIRRLKIDRPSIFQLVTGLSEPDLNRVGIHAKFGMLTIVEWTEFFLLHEAHHLYTIFQLANSFKQTQT